MSLISSTFVIAVHDEILLQTGVGRTGCHIEKLESVLSRVDQQMYYSDVSDIFEIAAWFGMALLHKDLKCKAPLIEPNLRRNLGKWST